MGCGVMRRGKDKTSQDKDWERGCGRMKAMTNVDRVSGHPAFRKAEYSSYEIKFNSVRAWKVTPYL